MRRSLWKLISLAMAGLLFASGRAAAQEARQITQSPPEPVREEASATNQSLKPHVFWDRKNLELFAGVAAVRTLDFTSTRHFRARGVDEVLLTNSIVDNKPLFVEIEAAGVAASIGISYWLHRKNHHKLERWVSIVHIGVAGFGDARNYTLKKSRPAP
jgi:hypothetical protein